MITLKHDSGITKRAKMGFSWTTFFFGFFVPLTRGDIKWAIILLLLSGAFGVFTFGIGAVVVGIVFSFKYNSIYIKELIEKGYRPVTAEDQRLLTAKGVQCNLSGQVIRKDVE